MILTLDYSTHSSLQNYFLFVTIINDNLTLVTLEIDNKIASLNNWIVAGGRPVHGVGIDENITTASFKALFSALNRSLSQQEAKAA